MPDKNQQIQLKIDVTMRDMRLDKALAQLLPDYSRASIQGWLKQGLVLVDKREEKAKYKLLGNETIIVDIPEPKPNEWQAQEMQLDIVAEDEHFIVINKPAGLVVHPGAGNLDQTLLNGLLYQYPELAVLARAGIVHRLDKDTTGLMVVARTEKARQHFVEQLQNRSMHRQYNAIVNGVLIAGQTIDKPIGRHSKDRLKMAVTNHGKPAITHIKVLEKYRQHTLIQANLETGRTHQIRVHMHYRGHALVGDTAYRGKAFIPHGANSHLVDALQQFPRQALHAQELSFIHPESGNSMTYARPMPQDMQHLLSLLRQDIDDFMNQS